MKKSIIIIVLIFFQVNCFAQSNLYSLELQAGGNAPTFGIKANRYFWLNHNAHFTVSAGLGWAKNISLMTDLTYSVGNGVSFFETGIVGFYSNDSYVEKQPLKYILAPLVGYKYLSPKKEVFRCHLTPIFADDKLYFWGGISLGFQLKRKYQEKLNIGTVRFTTK